MQFPFPGMDPYLEGYLWPDVHHVLASKIRQQLAPKLQPCYVAQLGVYVVEDTFPESEIGIVYADVEVMKLQLPRGPTCPRANSWDSCRHSCYAKSVSGSARACQNCQGGDPGYSAQRSGDLHRNLVSCQQAQLWNCPISPEMAAALSVWRPYSRNRFPQTQTTPFCPSPTPLHSACLSH